MYRKRRRKHLPLHIPKKKFYTFSINVYLCCRECAGHFQPDHSAPPHSLQLGLWVHPPALRAWSQETTQLPRVHPVPAGTPTKLNTSVLYVLSPSLTFSILLFLTQRDPHKVLLLLYLHLALRCLILGAAVGARKAGIRPEGQREEWRHLSHGLQWHYGHHQAPHAYTLCGGEPCLSECVCVWDTVVICENLHGHKLHSLLIYKSLNKLTLII